MVEWSATPLAKSSGARLLTKWPLDGSVTGASPKGIKAKNKKK